MTVAETQPTMTEGQKADAFDKWLELVEASNPGFAEAVEVGKGSAWFPAEAIAHAIADRKLNLAPWTPERGETYYSIGWLGAAVWDAWPGEMRAHDFGNVFRTREEAEAHAKLVRVFNRVFQMRAALGMMELSPWDVAAYFAVGSDTQQWNAIREQLEKEGAL